MSVPETTTVRLRPLSVVPENDDEVLVGDPETGVFVTIPAVGGVVINALLRGATLEETAAEAEAVAGEPVDIPSFVETLRELGFVDDGAPEELEAVRTAPIQARRWLAGVRQEVIRPFFGPVAWICYAACAVFSVAVFVTSPELFPRPAEDAFAFGDIGLSAVLLMPFSMVSMALHECGHWLAARAIGIRSRFGVDRRLMLLVFETDLTQVWAVPRRQRYGPLLGGMAIDAVVLAVLLGLRLLIHTGAWSPPETVDATLAVWVFVKLTGFLWQCMVFLRTDLYAVMVNALGCRNLWEVKSLMLRRAFGRLTPEQAAELDAASPADVRAARWFRWVWLAGSLGVLAWFAFFLLPVVVVVLEWAVAGVAMGPLAWQFWWALLCTGLLLGQESLAFVLAGREYVRRFAAWRRSQR
ncbi:hypothetical protein [Nonomuraea aridisoli]|uniref:PqqD family protein n=1 Tax=Nonomuraea aridisoli TaxID=2070368 RepID=A0A2W2ETJ5_9ACTN|nr:hypothetical protein [Nonomuraea aridisoli]PZG16850.1 hypothetical protein C1J01_19805 [Nonomuraea aridisoli]